MNIRMDKQTVIRVSDNGWTDRDITLDWLEYFNLYTKPQKRGTYRLLILDGSTNHVSLPFIEYCEQ